MRKYKDSCISLEVLKQDSGLLPKPREDWNTFVPEEGDYAKADGKDYQFINGEWIEVKEETSEEKKRIHHRRGGR